MGVQRDYIKRVSQKRRSATGKCALITSLDFFVVVSLDLGQSMFVHILLRYSGRGAQPHYLNGFQRYPALMNGEGWARYLVHCFAFISEQPIYPLRHPYESIQPLAETS